MALTKLFFQFGLTDQLNGLQVGVLTSQPDFQSIVGPSWTGMAQHQLWWSETGNGADNYQGFVPFNGWNGPSMHRSQLNVLLPGNVQANRDWMF